jgi:alpha-L-arabinofuranosidase
MAVSSADHDRARGPLLAPDNLLPALVDIPPRYRTDPRGHTLTSDVDETDLYGTVSTIDAVATHDRETGHTAIFLVNRRQSGDATVVIDLSALRDVTLLDAQTLADPDIHAKNTLTDNERVRLTPNESVHTADGVASVTLPPVPWTALAFG